jgi:hypothetical protein
MLKLVILATIVAFVGDMWAAKVLGYRLAGVAWLVPMTVAALVLARQPHGASFPLWPWLPWLVLVLVHAALIPFSDLDARVDPLQRTAQLFCPVLVGMAASTARPSAAETEAFLATFRRLIYLLIILIGIRSGVLLTGDLPDWSGLAPEAITVTLLCAFVVSWFSITTQRRYLVLWAVLFCIPVIMVTRMPILACLVTLPLAFGRIRLSRRMVALMLVIGLAVAVFYLPTFQSKTFYSSSGTIAELRLSNPDLATAGRDTMWRAMASSASDALWLGRGTGAGETLVREITSNVAYPHNDWLLTLYDYGIVGVVFLFASITLAARNALLRSRWARDPSTRLLLVGAATAFIPFVVMMISDNILVYASFFGNIQFAILGLGYGALARERADAAFVAVPLVDT